MNRTLLLALLAATLSSPAAAEPILKSEVVVVSPVVTVGDMFEDAGAFAEQALFRSPAPGTTGIVEIDAVMQATQIVGLTQFDHEGVLRVRVSRAATLVDDASLGALIVEDLTDRGIVSSEIVARITFDQPGIALNAEAVASPAVLNSLRYMPGSGSFNARFMIAGHDEPVDLGGRIELMIEAPHLVAAMRAGEIIDADDIEMKLVPLTQAESHGIVRPTDLIGKAMMRQGRAGLMLRASDVTEPDVIQRNEPVTVVYRQGALVLTVKGQALGGAAQGRPVSVLNLMTRRVLTGVAVAPGTVEVAVNQHVAGL